MPPVMSRKIVLDQPPLTPQMYACVQNARGYAGATDRRGAGESASFTEHAETWRIHIRSRRRTARARALPQASIWARDTLTFGRSPQPARPPHDTGVY